jgi:DNA helicase HerA-like ATPase
LIRSKGVGIYFISQNPSDIPDSILSQLGNRIQHSLRAYTPKDQKGVKVAAESFRENPEFSTIEAISNLEIGEALVSLLDEKGVPSIVQKVYILPPQSYLGSIDDEYRNQLNTYSVFRQKYAESFYRESAYECLLQKMDIPAEEIITQVSVDANQQNNQQTTPQNNIPQQSPTDTSGIKLPSMGDILNNIPTQTQTKRRSNTSSPLDKAVTTATNTIAREVSKQLVRGILGNLKL